MGCFQRLRVFETDFSFKRTRISQLWYHEIFIIFFLIFVFRKRHVIAEIDCVFVLAIRGLLHMTKNFVLWCDFCVLITVTESFWKVSLKRSWCCRKHVFVFEIVCLRGLNEFLIKLSFSLWLLGKKICSPLWKEFENFSILGVDFWVKPFEKVLMCSLFLDAP
jgi:hypothetical protein